MHKILLEEDSKPSRHAQRCLNPPMMEVMKKEVLKLLDTGVIYPILDNKWVSLDQIIPKTIGHNDRKPRMRENLRQRIEWVEVVHWLPQVKCLHDEDHFLLPFIDQMLKRLAGRTVVWTDIMDFTKF